MNFIEPTDAQLEAAAELAANVWAYGNSDEVWGAVMDPFRSRFADPDVDTGESVNVAAELLPRIENTPDFAAGDLTHEQTVTAILRRYPILGQPL